MVAEAFQVCVFPVSIKLCYIDDTTAWSEIIKIKTRTGEVIAINTRAQRVL